ncbi:tRNA (guanine(10)-N(2))-dimethyltransferase [Methanoregula sp.]|uniref:tRNA (guanine(10)-N(2))-dimethyltransferase n=1 Tax=Methanoregula sp. TaxID=2052170 RepID=UPI002CE5A596|nr:tRNA (guanine(10)-N(2))-dimethyltransferase [Methanoregula sp.]HVP97272.1 tRNA (guanine(10)-N(2))-dimethyltransferase [Methanoregula sp.]
MDVIEATEGTTTFLVPVQDSDGQFPPGTAPVFFNRRMEINRDATVLLLSVIQPSDYLDAMGATGVRGLRVANECGVPVTINDRDPDAIPLIQQNVTRSGLPVSVTCRDACSLLFEQSFDAVDIDPFGTPAPFTDAGIRGCRRFLLVTATDTAPLCGAHLKAGIRRYFARPANTGYHAEVGLRILLGFVARETVKYDRGIEPLFCFAREHFVRLNLQLIRGVQAADQTIARLGFILQCPSCAYREERLGMFPAAAACPFCGKPLHPIGPLFLGKIFSDEVMAQMQARLPECGLGTKKELVKLLTLCQEELSTSSHYDYHLVAQQLRVSPPKIEVLLERLRQAGYGASRTHYSGTGIKTDAPLSVIEDAIRGQSQP